MYFEESAMSSGRGFESLAYVVVRSYRGWETCGIGPVQSAVHLLYDKHIAALYSAVR